MILLDTDSEAYFALNPVGAMIYETVREPRTVSEIVDAVVEAFDVTRQRAETDVALLVEDLVQRKMLRPAPLDG